MRKIYAGIILFLMTIACFPGFVYAQSVRVSRVVGPEEGADASQAKFSVYFKAFDRNGLLVSGIEANQCNLTVARREPKIISSGMRPFDEGDQGVGVLVVYPMSKIYSEDEFKIRSTLTAFLRNRERDVDWFSAIGYDNLPHPVGWSKASEKEVALAVRRGGNSDVIEPNLFSTMHPAIAMLQNIEQVSKKYIVIITDAEGAVWGSPENALRLIEAFKKNLVANNITPIVVGYSPDGVYAMPNIHSFGRITTDIGSLYVTGSVNEFRKTLLRDVDQQIWGGYIYDVTYDMRGENYLAAGRYNIQMKVRTSEGEAIGYSIVQVPALRRMPWWLPWALLVALSGFGVCGFGIVLWRKEVARKKEEKDLITKEDLRVEEMVRAFAAEKMDVNAPSAAVNSPYLSRFSETEDSIEICEHAMLRRPGKGAEASSGALGAKELGRMEALLDNLLVAVTRSEILLEKILEVVKQTSGHLDDTGSCQVSADAMSALVKPDKPEAEAPEKDKPEAEDDESEAEDDESEAEDDESEAEDDESDAEDDESEAEDDESEAEDDESEAEDDESEAEEVTEADKPEDQSDGEKAKSDLDLLGLFMEADVSGLSAIGSVLAKPGDISSPELSGHTRGDDRERPLS